MASIQLVFLPVNVSQSSGSGLDSPNISGSYHEFTIYTNDTGQMFYIRGGPDGVANAQSSYGNIKVELGNYVANTPDFPKLSGTTNLDTTTFNSWQKITIASGPQSQLDPIWNNTVIPDAEKLQQATADLP